MSILASETYSPYGYWFSPDKKVFPLEKPQSHAEVMTSLEVFETDQLDEFEVVQKALEEGWIAVSISPVGDSVGIRVREFLPERHALKTMRSVLKADNLLNVVVHTDFNSGTASEIIHNLLNKCRDSVSFPDINDEINHVVSAIDSRKHDIEFLKYMSNYPGDFIINNEGIRDDLSRISKILDEMWSLIQSEYSTRVKDVEKQLDITNKISQELIDLSSKINIILTPIYERSIGFNKETTLLDLESVSENDLLKLDYAKSYFDDLNNNTNFSEQYKEMYKNFPNLLKFKAALDCFVSSMNLIPHYIDKMQKNIKEDTTIEELHLCSMYYIGHECTRTVSVGRSYYMKNIRESLMNVHNFVDDTPCKMNKN